MVVVAMVAAVVVTRGCAIEAGSVTLQVTNETQSTVRVEVDGWVSCSRPAPAVVFGDEYAWLRPGDACTTTFIVPFDWDHEVLCIAVRDRSDDSYDLRLSQRTLDLSHWSISVSEPSPRIAPSSIPEMPGYVSYDDRSIWPTDCVDVALSWP